MALALARLSAVADDLVAKGVAVERIRVAAQSAGVMYAPTLNQIDVLFRKSGETADEVAPPRLEPAPCEDELVVPGAEVGMVGVDQRGQRLCRDIQARLAGSVRSRRSHPRQGG